MSEWQSPCLFPISDTTPFPSHGNNLSKNHPMKTNHPMKSHMKPILSILFLATALPGFAQVSQYSVSKQAQFNQTSTSAPTADPTAPFRLQANVDVAAPTDLSSNPTVTKPAGGTGASPLSLAFNAGSGQYKNTTNFSTLALLNAAYFDGSYGMHMVSPSFGTKDVNLTLNPAAYTIPTDIPKLTNTSWSGGLLQLDPTVGNTLSWNLFTQLTGNDFVDFSLSGLGVNIDVKGSSTSQFLAANTLTPGQTYSGGISFGHVTTNDTTSVAGATGLAGYVSQTKFTVQAVPEPATASLLGLGAVLLAGRRRRNA